MKNVNVNYKLDYSSEQSESSSLSGNLTERYTVTIKSDLKEN